MKKTHDSNEQNQRKLKEMERYAMFIYKKTQFS